MEYHDGRLGSGDHPRPTKIETVDVDDDSLSGVGPAMDDSGDEPEIVGVSGFKGVTRAKMPTTSTSGAGVTSFIDLTGDDDEEMTSEPGNLDDSDIIVDNEDFDIDLPELIDVEPLSKKELAEQKRLEGNNHFKLGNYNQALDHYTAAIELVPGEVSYYANRAACYLMMRKHHDALSDTQTSLQIDPTYEKSIVRLIRIFLALGDIKACDNAIKKMTQLKKSSSTDVTRELQKLKDLKKHTDDIAVATQRKDYRRVLFLCERALEIADGDINMKVTKAYILMKLARHTEAGEIAAELIAANKQNMDAHIIRALCHYQLDNMDKSMSFLRAALQLNPDASEPKTLYKKIKLIKEQRETATDLFKQGKMDEAKILYTECLKHTTAEDNLKNTGLESKFFFNLSLISNRLRNYDEAIVNVSRAIDLNPAYLKAFIHRAAVYNAKEMYDEAVRDYEAALKIDPTKRELKNDIQNAKMAGKRAKRKDYYKILDINKAATEEEIRKAYKKRAMLHHPDRHASSTEAIQKEQEKHFKDVGEAYEVLSDPKKRIRYDQGHDLMDMQSSGPSAYYDPYDANQLFNMFFSTSSNNMGQQGRAGAGGPRCYQAGGRSHNAGFHRQF